MTELATRIAKVYRKKFMYLPELDNSTLFDLALDMTSEDDPVPSEEEIEMAIQEAKDVGRIPHYIK